jgi:HD-like signal output (HDOD) protein
MSMRNLIDENELKICVDLINQHKIPSPPQLLTDLNHELSSSTPNIVQITKWINNDIGLASSVLKTVNSSQFNLSDEVKSIAHAIKLLGLEKLKQFIIQPAYKLALHKSLNGFENISEHSHYIGKITQIIAAETLVESIWEPDVLYLAGLFHDVGVIVLASHYPDYMAFHDAYELRPITMPLMEKINYNVTHSAIGVLLAKKWGLPNSVCNAIYLHHHVYGSYNKYVDSNTLTLAAILKLANFFNHKMNFGSENQAHTECSLMYENAVKELLLTDEKLESIEAEVFSS